MWDTEKMCSNLVDEHTNKFILQYTGISKSVLWRLSHAGPQVMMCFSKQWVSIVKWVSLCSNKLGLSMGLISGPQKRQKIDKNVEIQPL